MSLEDEIVRVRTSVALAEEGRRGLLRLRGPDLDSVLDAVCPRQPFLHEGQILETLFCDAMGDIVGDVLIARAEDAIWLLVDGMSDSEVERYVREHSPVGLELEIATLGMSHDLLAVHGPYAWELLAEVLSPEVIGLPPHGCYFFGEVGCFRAGSVGEYAYQLLVPRPARAEFAQRFSEAGDAFDFGLVSSAALDVCRLENFVFNLHAEGRKIRDPLTLQLSWRLSATRDYRGASAHRARRAAGVTHRAVLVSSSRELEVGMQLEFDSEGLGEILAAAHSQTRGDFLGIARIRQELADPGLATLLARGSGEITAEVHVISAPAIDNRSVHTNPQRHSYATKGTDVFPPIGKLPTARPS